MGAHCDVWKQKMQWDLTLRKWAREVRQACPHSRALSILGALQGVPKLQGKLYWPLLKVKIRNLTVTAEWGLPQNTWNALHLPEGFGLFSGAYWEEKDIGSSHGIKKAPPLENLGQIQALQQVRVNFEIRRDGQRCLVTCTELLGRDGVRIVADRIPCCTCKSPLGCQGSGRFEEHCPLPLVDLQLYVTFFSSLSTEHISGITGAVHRCQCKLWVIFGFPRRLRGENTWATGAGDDLYQPEGVNY